MITYDTDRTEDRPTDEQGSLATDKEQKTDQTPQQWSPVMERIY